MLSSRAPGLAEVRTGAIARAQPLGRGPGRPAIALFIAALALRPSIIGVAPLAPAIASDLAVPHVYLSLLAAIPILCMGLFAPLGPIAARRFGIRVAMGAALLTIAAAGALRGVWSSPLAILGLTVLVGLGTGAAASLPPVVAKLRAGSGGIARATGAAAVGTVGSAMLAAAIAAPLAASLNGWRPALLVLGLVGLLPLIGWIVTIGPGPSHPVPVSPGRPVRRQPVAWLLALAFGLQAIIYWGASTWLPGAYVERGWTPIAAGGLLGLLNLSALGSSLAMTAVSDRIGRRAVQIIGSAVAVTGAALGFVAAPWLGSAWTVLLGLGLGWIFPALLAFSADIADDAATAGALSAFMLLGGYVIAATGPVALGLARDATGAFGLSFSLLVLVGAGLIGAAIGLRGHGGVQ